MKQPLVPRQIERTCTVMICFVLFLLAVAPGLVAQRSVWPNCNFNCTAKDVVLTRVYTETLEGGCTEGAPVTATIWGVFDASAARYAVWMIGDIYANGTLIQRIEECVIDSISPGTTEVPLAVVTWPCGAPLELENMVVSWTARTASCIDEPGCQERGAKCSRPSLTPIYVYPNLVVDFTTDEPQCPGMPVTFTAIVTGGAAPYAYDWDFGDGRGTSVQENPQYSYADAGRYTVQLTVSDGSGQREMQTKVITILNPPSVFADNSGPYCEGETIELSASGGSTYAWFGPGGFTNTDQNPVITNATIGDGGTYTVHVTDSSGCVAEAATDVVVNACQRTLTIASTNGGSVSAPGEGSFTYDVGTEVSLEAVNDPCYIFSGWVGDVDELADPGAASTFITLERDTLLEAHFVFHDTEPPTLDCPPDVIVECGDPITPESLGMATALDTCDPSPIVTYVDDEAAGACPGEMTITRTWTATDTAGNSVECVQTIEVRDTTPPALTLSNKTFECDGAGNVDDIAGWLADPIGADDCSEVVISNDYGDLIGTCPGTGAALVTFTATDECGNSTERMATVTIVDTTPPNAGDDAAATPEDTPVTIPVLENDEDTCSKSLDIVSVGAPSLGDAEISGNQIRYTPQMDAAGTDSFTYTVEDCSGNRDTALIEITVTPVNGPPVAQDQVRTTDEDTATGFFSLAVSDPDNTLTDLSCDCVSPPMHGTVERGANYTVNYRPGPDFDGIDTFGYKVCDPEGLCDTATVTVTVTGENDNPSIEATDQTTQEDTPVSISVTHSDPDGDPLTCVVLEPTHGTVTPASATITGPYPQSGELVYTPDPEFNGTDNFTITCDDGKGGAATALVEITQHAC
jgi:PKD repeat protein